MFIAFDHCLCMLRWGWSRVLIQWPSDRIDHLSLALSDGLKPDLGALFCAALNFCQMCLSFDPKFNEN